MVISGYSIYDYWLLFYLWLLVVILFMAIVAIIFMVIVAILFMIISCYFRVGYWLLF